MSEKNQQAPEQNYGPGNVLRAKREEFEWSVEAVAEALHLSTHSVKAIEADRYDDLPGATYVMGYWRSYARLLGIDIEDTIEANKRNLNIVTPEAAGLDVNRAFRHKSGRNGKGWILTLLIIGGFVYYAWQQQFFGLFDTLTPNNNEVNQEEVQPADPAPEAADGQKKGQVLRPLKTETLDTTQGETDVPANTAAMNNSALSTSSSQSSSQPSDGLVLQTINSTQVGQASTGAQSGLVMTEGSGQTNSTSTEPAAQDTLPAEKKPVNNEPVNVANVDAAQDGVVSNASDAVSSPDDASTMVLTLTKDSWLDIRDKSQNRLLYKTESAGQEIEVKGTPPFYVYIGTPDGVTVRYRGKNVPFETHKSGLFARFKLGDDTLEEL